VIARGCLLGLLGVAAGFAAVGLGVDVGARHLATARVESSVGSAVPGAHGIHARIHSWPFLKVALNGRVDEIGVHVDRLVEKPVTFTDVNVKLTGIDLRVGKLATGARVTIGTIRSGRATAEVTPAALAAAMGEPVGVDAAGRLTGGKPGATPQPVVVKADQARHLFVAVPGVRVVALPLPGPDLLPCVPAVTNGGGLLNVSCTFDKVPTAFSPTS